MPSEFLRGEPEIAVNALAVACREAADVHETASSQCEDTTIAAQLDRLAQSRREAETDLADLLAQRYDGPNWPEPERELVRKAVTWAKAALSPDATKALLSDCRAAEARVRDAATEAGAQPLPPALRTRVLHVLYDSEAQVAALAQGESG